MPRWCKRCVLQYWVLCQQCNLECLHQFYHQRDSTQDLFPTASGWNPEFASFVYYTHHFWTCAIKPWGPTLTQYPHCDINRNRHHNIHCEEYSCFTKPLSLLQTFKENIISSSLEQRHDLFNVLPPSFPFVSSKVSTHTNRADTLQTSVCSFCRAVDDH